MIRAALYPVSVGTLPIASFLNNHISEYCITTLIALPGSGLCGKDSGYADNRGTTGYCISDSIIDTQTNWDVLFVSEAYDPFNEADTIELIVETILKALELHKKVICCKLLSQSDLEKVYSKLQYLSDSFVYLPNHSHMPIKRTSGSIYNPSQYIIYIGGLISEANSLEIFLNLYNMLNKSYTVLALSTNINIEFCGGKSLSHIIYSSSYSEVEKIYAINDFIKHEIEKELPDIIVVHMSEPMMEYNEFITNGFGIYPYMLSKAVVPDFFICAIPYSYGNSSYIENVSNGIMNRLGYAINYVHLSNAELDGSIMYEQRTVSVTYKKYDEVENQIQEYCKNSNIKVNNIMKEEGLEDLFETIIDDFTQYNRTLSVINS